MDDRRALMRAIIDNPDEDTPRLALADWLDEYGDAHDRARAAFIRLQVQAVNALPGKPREKLAVAAGKLEYKHRKSWLKPLVDVSAKLRVDDAIDFRRGLLTYLMLDTGEPLLKKWRDLLADAVAAVGVEELHFYSATTRVNEFLDLPLLRWAARISYPGADNKFLAALAAGPNCAHLSGLSLREVAFTDLGLKMFAESTATTQLRALTITTEGALTSKKPKFTAHGIVALLNSDRLPHLEVLELDTGTAKFNLAPLLVDAGLRKLKTLWVTCFTRVADVIASPHLTNLNTLILHEAEMTDADADVLVGPTFAKLEEVSLSIPSRLSPAAERKLKKRFGKGLTLECEQEE